MVSVSIVGTPVSAKSSSATPLYKVFTDETAFQMCLLPQRPNGFSSFVRVDRFSMTAYIGVASTCPHRCSPARLV